MARGPRGAGPNAVALLHRYKAGPAYRHRRRWVLHCKMRNILDNQGTICEFSVQGSMFFQTKEINRENRIAEVVKMSVKSACIMSFNHTGQILKRQRIHE